MICRIKLFAAARQFAGCDEVTLELADGATVAELRTALAMTQPELASLLPSTMIALNTKYARESDVIPPQAEIALIPPVSGG